MKWKCWTISKGGELRWLGGRAMALDWRSQSFHKLSEVPFFEHCHWASYLLTTVTWAGMGPSVCAHWTMADHCGHMGEQQARQTFGGKKMNIFQGRRFERAQGWEPDLYAFQPLASRRPNPHAKVFNCQDLYWKLLPVKERGLSSWWRRRERSTPGLIRNLAAGFFKYGLYDVFIKLQLSRPWVYGQFSPTVLPAVCHLLHTSPYLRPAERANPVKVCSTFPTNWKNKPWFWKINPNFD